MRQMNHNSLEVYHNEVKPTLSKRQAEVLEVLKRFDKLTLFEIALQMSITQKREVFMHTISGRLSEMRDMELIIEAGRRSINGKSFTVWQIVKPKVVSDPGTQGNLF